MQTFPANKTVFICGLVSLFCFFIKKIVAVKTLAGNKSVNDLKYPKYIKSD